MWKDFKEFAIKGNMIDLAIGVVLGAAFGGVINSIVNDLLTPFIAWLFQSPDFSNMFVLLKRPEITASWTYSGAIAGGNPRFAESTAAVNTKQTDKTSGKPYRFAKRRIYATL